MPIRRTAVFLGTLGIVGSLAAVATVEPASSVASTTTTTYVMCSRLQHMYVYAPSNLSLQWPFESTGETTYGLENDFWRPDTAQCVTNLNRRTNLKVTKSAAVKYEWQAFPELWRGCNYGLCTPGSRMPRRVRRLTWAGWWATLRTSHRGVTGQFNTSLDIWFCKTNPCAPNPDGAELMVWLNEPGIYKLPSGTPRYHIDGTWWYLVHWRTHHSGLPSWNYMQFRRVRPVSTVRRLHLHRFVRVAERLGLIAPWWWLNGIDAGFEIVTGGKGLTIHRFIEHLGR